MTRIRSALAVLAAWVLMAVGTPNPAQGGDDPVVPNLRGLAEYWKARYDSRGLPIVLAIDTKRDWPRPKPTTIPDQYDPPGPWRVPVTDVLEIPLTGDVSESLAVFEHRLDDPSARHDDVVIANGFIGHSTPDSGLFALAVDRVRGARLVFAWTVRYGTSSELRLEYDRDGGYLGIPLFAVQRSELTSVVKDVLTYRTLYSSDSLPTRRWDETRAISNEEIRYVAVRDVLYASYGRSFERAPELARRDAVRALLAATGGLPRRRLQAFWMLKTWDREVCLQVLGPPFDWLLDVARADGDLASHPLGVVWYDVAEPVAREIGLDLVLIALDRFPMGSEGEIPHVLSRSTPRALPIDQVRTLLASACRKRDVGLRGLAGLDDGARVQVLLALAKAVPNLVSASKEIPLDERERFLDWLRGLRAWAPPLEEPIRSIRELFGA